MTLPETKWSEGPPLPRWALWLMLPGMIAPLLIFLFILRSESAHDECPYHEVERRSLARALTVVEEARNCIGEVEERRYTLLRDTTFRRLGERRFDKQAFAKGNYTWSAAVTKQGEVQVKVYNQGHADVLFREGTAEEHEKGVSR